jgi:hypothetical protein
MANENRLPLCIAPPVNSCRNRMCGLCLREDIKCDLRSGHRFTIKFPEDKADKRQAL